ncbi:uncharacterized protein LOC129592979 [Paramacrobiotus metropolitanus]|uniref:uncharacterized protein LOC129592979 n=1 Tax=Paramacrobiotus metropolitanus TaxID=2943436 RepID=UPI002445D571|nr:uncharacterized protein LOC129592979 [Paramacrobiotus metropolitanus]
MMAPWKENFVEVILGIECLAVYFVGVLVVLIFTVGRYGWRFLGYLKECFFNDNTVEHSTERVHSCACYQLGNAVLDSLVILRCVGCWMFLSFPLTEFLFPESLQLPILANVQLVYLFMQFCWLFDDIGEKQQMTELTLDAVTTKSAAVSDSLAKETTGVKNTECATCSQCGFTMNPCRDVDSKAKTAENTADARDSVEEVIQQKTSEAALIIPL